MNLSSFCGRVCVVLLVSACQTPISKQKTFSASDLILNPAIELKPPQNLTDSEVHEDIELLKFALRNGYGGRKYVPPNEMQSALTKLSQVRGPVSPEVLRDQVDEALWVISDNHLKARLNGQHAELRKKHLAAIDVGPNAISDPQKIWEVRLDNVHRRKILYVSITQFPSSKDSVWNGFIDEVKNKSVSADAMVVDLRGNGGGDDTMGYALARFAYGGPFQHPIVRQYKSQTPATFAIAMNGPRLQALLAKQRGQPVPPYLEELAQEQEALYRSALTGALPTEKVEESPVTQEKFNATTGFNKPILVLIDHGCGSSCESTVDAFEPHPKVTRVGARTLGMLQFGNVGALVLPHSKVHIQIATHYNEYFDKRSIEQKGIAPDITVKSAMMLMLSLGL